MLYLSTIEMRSKTRNNTNKVSAFSETIKLKF